MTGEEIDTSDIPPLDEALFADARLRMPEKLVCGFNHSSFRLVPQIIDPNRSGR